MSKLKYAFSTLRYVHDAVTHEFVTVGVVLYSAEARILMGEFCKQYRRASDFFSGINGEHFRGVVRTIERRISSSNEEWEGLFPPSTPESISVLLNRILPIDDSAFQFAAGGAGVTSDLNRTLESLYDRYVTQYMKRPSHERRTDEHILRSARTVLTQRKLSGFVSPKTIRGHDYEHEFPIAWKNGIWNTCEAVSFDFTDGSRVLERATHWLGRAVSLEESSEAFKLYLLVGKPQDSKLLKQFAKAQNILNQMPLPHEFIDEEDAGELADYIQADVSSGGHAE